MLYQTEYKRLFIIKDNTLILNMTIIYLIADFLLGEVSQLPTLPLTAGYDAVKQCENY